MSDSKQRLRDALDLMTALGPFVDPSRKDGLLRAWNAARAQAIKAADEYADEAEKAAEPL